MTEKRFEEDFLEEEGFTETESLGVLLRSERERRGVTREQLFQRTRLRPNLLEALENEDWERLPAPTFVKGFLRSYANALGMDEKKILKLYAESTPGGGATPFDDRKKEPTRNRRLLLFILILIVFAGVGFYLWKQYPPDRLFPMIGWSDKTAEIHPPQENLPARKDTPPPWLLDREEPVEKPDLLAQSEPPVERMELPSTGEEQESPPSVEEPESVHEEVQEVPDEVHAMALDVEVRERTWVKLIVDGAPAREVILNPGTRAVWKAEKAFDLLIGNAGGLVLEFNGKKLGALGASGQVVRLRLPEDFEKRSVQN
jgi:cytoskeleton protein RodZ